MAAPLQRGTATVAAASSSTAASVSKPTGVVTGDLLVAVHVADASGSYTAMTAPTGWTLAGGRSDLGGAAGYIKVWQKIAGASEGTSYSFGNGGSGSDSTVVLSAWQTGTYDAVAPVSQLTFGGSGTSTTSYAAPSVAGESDDRLLVVVGPTGGSPGTVTTPSGMTLLGSTNSGAWTYEYLYTQVLTSNAATGTKTATGTTARDYLSASMIIGSATVLANAADTAALGDTATDALAANRQVTEAVSLGDAVSATYVIPKSAAEVAGLADAVRIGRDEAAADTLGGSDAVTLRQALAPHPADEAIVREFVTAELVHGEIQDYQFLLQAEPRVPFGLDQAVAVTTFDPGSYEIRNQDVNTPWGDYRLFGTDRKTPPTWAFTMWTNTYSPAEALGWNDLMSQVWDSAVTRSTPGGVVALTYSVAGRRRRVYGRPRRYTALPDGITYGRIHITADFALAEDIYYDEAEQSIQIPMRTGFIASSGIVLPAVVPWRFNTGTAPRTEVMRITGTQAAWVDIEVFGPVANPWVKLGNMTVGLSGSISAGQSVRLSGRPWMSGVYRSDGAWVPQMLDPRARLSQLQVPPGEYPVTYGGSDNTGSSRVTVSWRNAYRSL